MSGTPLTPPNVQFEVNDRGGQYLQKLRDLAQAVDDAINEYNLAISAGTDSQQTYDDLIQFVGQKIAEMEGIRDQTAAISESGLPEQAGQENKALTSDGEHFSWQHTSGFSRFVSENTELVPGDKVLFNATQELDVSLPETIPAGSPFLIRNSATSTHDIILQVSEEITTLAGKTNWQNGDTLRIKPSEQIFLFKSNSQLEAIL